MQQQQDDLDGSRPSLRAGGVVQQVQSQPVVTAREQAKEARRNERVRRAAEAAQNYSLWQCLFHTCCAIAMASRVQYWSLDGVVRICSQRDDPAVYYAEAAQSWEADYYGAGHWLTTVQLWWVCTAWTMYNLWSRRKTWDGRFNDYCLIVHDVATLALLMQCRFTPHNSLFFLFVHSIHDIADVALGVLKMFAKRFKRTVYSDWSWVLPALWFVTRIWRYGQFVWLTHHAPTVLYIELVLLWILDVSWFVLILLYLVRLRRASRQQNPTIVLVA